jgi:hypothetical protein
MHKPTHAITYGCRIIPHRIAHHYKAHLWEPEKRGRFRSLKGLYYMEVQWTPKMGQGTAPFAHCLWERLCRRRWTLGTSDFHGSSRAAPIEAESTNGPVEVLVIDSI